MSMNATTKNLLLHLPVQLPPKPIWFQPMDNLGRRMPTANLFQHTVPPVQAAGQQIRGPAGWAVPR